MGRTPSFTSDGLKKGVWTAEEDQKLISYVHKHGEGGWRSLPNKAGLQRCGKSCRLRWTNYLKPGIRRGEFTPEEDQTIFKLHAQLGNRWATIAKHLPGRTDQEIKNYWHAHLKKRLAKTDIHPKITSGSSSSGNSDCTTVTSADPKTQQSEPKRQRSASALLLNKLATRVTKCVGAQTLQPMPFNGNNISIHPFLGCTVPDTPDNDIAGSLTTPESENVIDEGVLNDIIASEFSSQNNKEIHSDSTTVDYCDVSFDDDHMIFDTVGMGSLGFYDCNLFSLADDCP
ncbi:hypothetical protein HRI_000658500 [Hibiscus trionum]|uniref:Uncharacterized protein n=1 Tax=Hibiscus trionum TaxID=183268 RepID=A0A9W7H2J9_HIBTR|nr:hypothetical protein HRI_000658500 [Hibiscus trionum]